MRLTIQEARRRRDRGIALLDAEVPDWRDRVRKELLDMEDGEACVCGQLFGRFSFAAEALGLTDSSELPDYGFDVTEGEFDAADESYRVLEDVWLEVLR